MGVTLVKEGWAKAEAKDTCGDIVFYRTSVDGLGYNLQTKLPPEFFAHELVKCNPNNDEAVFEFAKTWGIPFHPLRFVQNEEESKRAMLKDIETFLYDVGIHETNQCAMYMRNFEREEYTPEVLCISELEAKNSIKFMQAQVDALFRCLEEEASYLDYYFVSVLDSSRRIDDAISPNYDERVHLHMTYRFGERPSQLIYPQVINFSLTNAIANQICETMKDPAEWRRCCWCGNYFKRKRSTGKKTDKASCNSIYCSDKCYQSMKDYRTEKIKTPPDWWTPEQAKAERNKGKGHK